MAPSKKSRQEAKSTASISPTLRHILDSEPGERAAVQFLGNHPHLLRDYFITPLGHCQYVLTEVSLGGEYYMDAVVLNGYSGAWQAFFIEFEPVDDPVFNKSGTPSARTAGALKQIKDWKAFMKLNPEQFRRSLAKLCKTKDRLKRPDPSWEPCTYSNHRLKDAETVLWDEFWIISGRRDRLSPEVRALMARERNESGVFFATYDGFLDLALNWDAAASDTDSA